MSVVVDSSVAVSWCLPDEMSSISDAALDLVEKGSMHVPALFWYELHNVLIVSERRGRVTEQWVQGSLKRINALPIIYDHHHDETMVMQLARQHTLSIYDAAYLELATRKEFPLATLDKALNRAALEAKVWLVNA